MTISMEDLLKSILDSFDRMEHIKSEDIPNIDLYMDQVTTFMEKRLKNTTRNPEEDKILTKTMINNYAKNHLLPSPEKKKYTKEHILVLLFIYYFKGVLSIGDIQTLLNPITEQFFNTGENLKLEDIYEEVFSLEAGEIQSLKEDVSRKFEASQTLFDDAKEESRAFLKQFAFVCMLSYDVYVKKLLIEKIIDGMRQEDGAKHSGKKEGKKEAKKEAKKENETKLK